MEMKTGENRPSEVFLALWYYRAKREPLSVENFKLCAETWRELANKEDRHAADERLALSPLHPEDSGPPRAAIPAEPELTPHPAAGGGHLPLKGKATEESGPNRTPEDGGPAEDLTPHPAAGGGHLPLKGKATEESGPDRTPKETDAELEARKAEEEAKVRSDAGAKSLATRKRNVRAALEELRAAGVKLREIADADQRLSINDVLQMLEAKPVSLPVLSALERAISALRARDAGPSEEDMT